MSSISVALESPLRSARVRTRAGLGPGVAFLACSASALAYAALFPPLDLAWLALVALVPYLWIVSRLSPGRAAMCGALWAVLATSGVAWWLPQMLGGYFGLGRAASWLGLAGVGLLTVGPWQAAFAGWLAWRTRRGVPSPFVVGAAWAAVEFARAHAPIPNPVGLLAYSQSDTVLGQVADLAGPYGIAALLVAVNAALAGALRSSVRLPAWRWPVASVVIALGMTIAYGQWRLAQSFSEGEPVRVALVQGAVTRAADWDRATRSANLERYLTLTRSAAAARPDLVFWPEFALDFYLNEPTLPRAKLFSEIRAVGADLVTGASHYETGPAGTRYFNSVFLVDRGGRIADRYDKTHLMPFAEYGPLGDWMRARTAMYEPGEGLRTLSGAAARVGAFVCGESLFPEVARGLASRGADLLANPSNDYWFVEPAGAEQHLRVAAMRAIENRRWLVRPTATGYSAVIDPYGHVVARSGFGDAEVLEARVWRSHESTPYQRWGDAPVAIAIGAVLASSVRGGRASSPTTEGDAG